MDVTDSILNSVKKLLGIEPESMEFDADVMMNINAALSTLTQIGIGPKEGFVITSETETYSDFLGEESKNESNVKMYLFYKTRLGFDPPSSTAILECIKQMIAETEWRLYVSNDESFDIFEEKGGNSK